MQLSSKDGDRKWHQLHYSLMVGVTEEHWWVWWPPTGQPYVFKLLPWCVDWSGEAFTPIRPFVKTDFMHLKPPDDITSCFLLTNAFLILNKFSPMCLLIREDPACCPSTAQFTTLLCRWWTELEIWGLKYKKSFSCRGVFSRQAVKVLLASPSLPFKHFKKKNACCQHQLFS